MALPFQFEPEFSDDEQVDNSDYSEEESEDEAVEENRITMDVCLWCRCGRCSKMETTKMCICCQELASIEHLTEGKLKTKALL